MNRLPRPILDQAARAFLGSTDDDCAVGLVDGSRHPEWRGVIDSVPVIIVGRDWHPKAQ